MKKNQFIQSIGCLTIASLFVLSGCATQVASTQPVSVEPFAVDDSTPAVPATAEPVIEIVEAAPKAPAPEPKAGSVASVVKKMAKSQFTLYWRDNNSYSYYVGGAVKAEYLPGEGLVVQEGSLDDSSLTCKYDGGGSLDLADADPKMKEACSKLMFTLDSELSE